MIPLADYVIWVLITLAGTWLTVDALRDLVCDQRKPWYVLGFVLMCFLQIGCGILVLIGSYGYALKMMEGICHTVTLL